MHLENMYVVKLTVLPCLSTYIRVLNYLMLNDTSNKQAVCMLFLLRGVYVSRSPILGL